MRKCLAILAAMAIGSTAAQEAVRQADPPLVVNGDLALTTRDFLAYVERVPADRRDEFRSSLERISKTVDGLWLQRMLAKKSLDAGFDKDPLVVSRRIQAQDAVLADAFIAAKEREFQYPDAKSLEARAREIYLANSARFTVAEEVHVQHVLIGPTWRTEEMALARANEVRAKALDGKEDFLALARRYSDDSSVKNNDGDLGWVSPASFVGPFTEAVAKMKTPGEVSEPVRTQFGIHVIKFLGRKVAKLMPYEQVKDRIVTGEKERLLAEYRDKLFAQARGEPGNQVFMENVEKLKVDVKMPDPKEVARVQAQAIERQKERLQVETPKPR